MKKIIIALLVLMVSGIADAKTNNGLYVGVRCLGTSLSSENEDAGIKETNAKIGYSLSTGIRVNDFRVEADGYFASKTSFGNYEYTQHRAMLQFYYDVPMRLVIRPFFNAGAGLAFTTFDKRLVQKKKKDFSSFAWNVGGGLTLAVSSAFNLDVGYRYVDVAEKDIEDWGKFKTKVHEGYLGVRYTF